MDEMSNLDGLILAVPHAEYLEQGPAGIVARLGAGGVLIDVKSVIPPESVPASLAFWSL